MGIIDKLLNTNKAFADFRYKYLKQAQDKAVPLIHGIAR